MEAFQSTNSGLCLDTAALWGSIPVFDILLKSGAKLENSRPLHQALRGQKDSTSMLAYLLNLPVDIESIADPNDQYSTGTPLESAIRHRAPGDPINIVGFLLENGADPHPGGRRGIDLVEEPFRSQLQEIHEKYSSQVKNMPL